MYFNLKKYQTSGLTYKDDGQITASKIENGKIVNTNIIFSKPYKIQIRASKVLRKKRVVKKETMTFSPKTTLIEAIKTSSKRYNELMDSLDNYIYDKKYEMTGIIKPDMLFETAWKLVRDKEDANGKDNSIEKQFYNNWLQSLYKKPLNKIAPNDIRDIADKLKRLGRADRTQRRAYEVVNYIYTQINKSTTDFVLISPASKKGLPALRNKTNLELTLEESRFVAQTLRDYPVSPVREIFMWLLHGRRRGEVLSLKWEDIDFKKGIYTIKNVSNKAGVNMTYKLSKRLLDTLDVMSGLNEKEKMTGYIFTGKEGKPFSKDSLREHWKRIRSNNNFQFNRMHDLRKLIGEYMLNQMLQTHDVIDTVLGHIPQGISSRYATIKNTTVGYIVDSALDGLLEENESSNNNNFDKLKQLQVLFPDKSIEQLMDFLRV